MAEERTTRLNLLKPATNATDWETEVENWADKLDEAAAQYLSFYYEGVAIDEEVIVDGFRFEETVDIVKITLYARTAPVGAALQVDFLKGGVEQSKLASINAGQNKGSAAVTGLSYTSADDFGLKIKNTGATEEGGNLTLVVHYNVQPVVAV